METLLRGYQKVSYNRLQSELRKAWEDSGKSDLELAIELEVKSATTAKNAFQPDNQIVSDEILTKVFNSIGLSAYVVWENGQRNYYIKAK